MGHGIALTHTDSVILRNIKILCTHASAKSLFSDGVAFNYRAMSVWANRDDDAGLVQLITGGFTFDADVQ